MITFSGLQVCKARKWNSYKLKETCFCRDWKLEFKLSFWFNFKNYLWVVCGCTASQQYWKDTRKEKRNKCTISLFIKGLCKTEKRLQAIQIVWATFMLILLLQFCFSRLILHGKIQSLSFFYAKILLIWQKKSLQIVHTLCVKTYTVNFNRMTKSFSSSLLLCV